MRLYLTSIITLLLIPAIHSCTPIIPWSAYQTYALNAYAYISFTNDVYSCAPKKRNSTS